MAGKSRSWRLFPSFYRDDHARIGHADARSGKRPADPDIEIGSDIGAAVFRIADPESEFQVDPAVGELAEQCDRRRIRENPRMLARNVYQNAHRMLDVSAVVYLYLRCQPHVGVCVRMVDHRL